MDAFLCGFGENFYRFTSQGKILFDEFWLWILSEYKFNFQFYGPVLLRVDASVWSTFSAFPCEIRVINAYPHQTAHVQFSFITVA